MNKQKAAIAILVAVHVITGLVLGWFVEDGSATFVSALFIGLVFSQTSLLGFWGGLGMNRWPVRLLGVIVGTAYLGPMFGISIRELNFEMLFLVVLSTVAVAAVLLVVRRLVAQIQRSGELSITASQEGLQFSIRHLMLLTFVVACTLGIGRWLQPYFSGVIILAELATISLCFVSVGLASVWAMFGKSPPLIRSIVVLLIAASSGCIPAYSFNTSEYSFWISMMLAEAVFLLVSLWIVRLCGYRLVRLSRSHTPSSTNE